MKNYRSIVNPFLLTLALMLSACIPPQLITEQPTEIEQPVSDPADSSEEQTSDRAPGNIGISSATNANAVDTDSTESSIDDDSIDDDSVENIGSEIANADEILPIDPKIRKGQLENGLTYYIRQNQEPENRAELRLVINAGSLQEDEDQLGVAHFLEHMLFNGTEKFAGNEIIGFLEGIGMSFGPDLNAYTSYDETVYILKIPTNDADTVETSFDILKEWAAFATLDEEEIEKERGVIVEEWRLRDQGASARIRHQLLPLYFGGSRYDEREPIGDMEIVRNAPRDAFVRFYEDWYRPNLMSVVAVGDFDIDTIEELITERFGPLTNPEDAPERIEGTVPDFDETRYKVITDPENPVTILRIGYNTFTEEVPTVGGYRNRLLPILFYQLLNFRLDEIARAADSPYLGSFAGNGGLVRSMELATFGAQVEDNGVQKGLEAVLTEVERARRYGFTESELDRAKVDLLNRYEQANKESNNTNSSDLADEYIRNFLTGEPIPGIAVEYELVQDLLPTITVDDITEITNILVGNPNRSVVVTAPEKEGVDLPTEAELATIVEDVLASDIEPYVDDVVEGDLIDELPAPAAIIATEEVPELDLTIIELENGARVIMKPTDFKDEEVVFSAYSPGGSSLVSDEDFVSADMIASVVGSSGVGNFDQTSLLKLLSGKSVSINPVIDERNEGFSGSAVTDDLETLFQLLHLYITAPRADEDTFESLRSQMRAELVNRESSPFTALQDATTDALFGDSIRRRTLTIEEVDSMDLERGFEIYQERFADVSDFTFVVVGSFEIETVTELAQQYIGTLPALDRDESWTNVVPELPAAVINSTVYKGQDEQSIVQIVFHGELDATPENRIRIRVMEQVLDLYIRNEIREERGGAYTTQTFSNISTVPNETYLLGVAFATEPDRVTELAEVVFEEVQLLQIAGASDEDVNKIKEQILRSREEQKQDNGFWNSVLSFYLENTDEDWLDALTYEERVAAITADDVQQAAIDYLNEDNYVEVVLYPEGYSVNE